MSAALAQFLCLLFVLWLYARDSKQLPKLSWGLWLPLLWVIIIGSKPVSAWLGSGIEEATSDFSEGSPLDRAALLVLIAAGIAVLLPRRLQWGKIFSQNKWLFIYFGYLAVSCLWSEYPFVSIKRWVKDAGNIVMVLVILSEKDPVAAAKAVLLRCGYLLIPFSVVYVKYIPSLGRYYDQWTGQPYYCGVMGNKNAMGMSLFVCTLFLFWKMVGQWDKRKARSADKLDLPLHGFLMLMCGWLLFKAHSSTAMVCTILGAAILLALRLPAVRSKVEKFGLYTGAIVIILLLLNSVVDLGASFVELVGRDLTFTGRTAIWNLVLSEGTNPVIGVGFSSFWLGDRTARLSEAYFYDLNQAHNGYIETYLNNGYVGVALLLVVIAFSFRPIKRDILSGVPFGALRLAFLIPALFYNMTEAAFDRLDLLWFGMLLVVIECPRIQRPVPATPKAETGRPKARWVAAPEGG